jgi:hypothetical protein
LTKSRLPALRGLDELLKKQAEETAALRAARAERRALNDDGASKRYRLGPENADGTRAIDVADCGTENWRQREMCPSLQHAERRLRELTAEQAARASAPRVNDND